MREELVALVRSSLVVMLVLEHTGGGKATIRKRSTNEGRNERRKKRTATHENFSWTRLSSRY